MLTLLTSALWVLIASCDFVSSSTTTAIWAAVNGLISRWGLFSVFIHALFIPNIERWFELAVIGLLSLLRVVYEDDGRGRHLAACSSSKARLT